MPPQRSRKRNNYHRKDPNAISAAQCESTDKDKMVQLKMKHNKQCMFCKHKEIDETKYGPLYKLNDVVVHYFCILLSSSAIQSGADHEGIWGFLLKDIKAELIRGSKEVCFYCKKPGATISCCHKKCDKIFHLPCGMKNGSLHQYFQKFKSFCQEHRITQRVDLNVSNNTTLVQCVICMDDVHPTPTPDSLWAPCCRHNTWFHRKCVQEMALNAGYLFKCPMCNNDAIFKLRMLRLGIYIPSRDASWETVPNAYSELYDRPNICSAPKCLCSDKKEKTDNKKEEESWELVLCNTCGSYAVHMLCGGVKSDQPWNCESCKAILLGSSSAKKKRFESSYRESVTPTIELINSESIASAREITPRQTKASTSVVTRSATFSASELTVKKEELSTIGSSYKQAKASASGLSYCRAEASTSRLSNGPAETLTSELSNSQAKASTSRLSNSRAEASTIELSYSQVEASTSGLSNRQAKASTSGLSNSQVEASTIELSYSQVEASTSGLSNRQAKASTSGLSNSQAKAFTSRLSNSRAEASTSGLSNRQAEAFTSELSNSQAKASTSGLSNSRAEASTSGFSNRRAQEFSHGLSNGQAESFYGKLLNQKCFVNGLARGSVFGLSIQQEKVLSRLTSNIVSRKSENLNEVNINNNLTAIMDYESQPSRPNQFGIKRRQRKSYSQCSTSNPKALTDNTIIISDDSDDPNNSKPSKPKRFVKRGQRKRSSQCSTLNPRSFINETIIISDSDSDDLVNDSKMSGYVNSPRVPSMSPPPFVITNVKSLSTSLLTIELSD